MWISKQFTQRWPLISWHSLSPLHSPHLNSQWQMRYRERLGRICPRYSNSRNEIETYLNPWSSWDTWTSCWSLVSLRKRSKTCDFSKEIYTNFQIPIKKNQTLLFTRELLSQPYNFRSQILATAITIIHLGFRFQLSKAFIYVAEVLSLQTLAKTSYFRIVTQKHKKHIVLFSTGKKRN